MGAALAYYTMFSLAPLLMIVVSVAGLVFGEDAARGEIQAQLQELMGAQGAGAVQGLLASVREPAEGMTATAVGLVLLFVGATTVFAELQDALDRIWRVPGRLRKSGWFTLVRSRLLAFGMILAVGFLLIVSLVTSAMLAAVGRRLDPVFGGWQAGVEMGNAIGGFLLVTIMFGLIYKIMPHQRVRVSDVWLGAVLAALLFTGGKYVIGAYIGRSGVALGFGAAGSLVVVLLWVYFSAQILLVGAEFTSVYARTFGSRKAMSSDRLQYGVLTCAAQAARLRTSLPSQLEQLELDAYGESLSANDARGLVERYRMIFNWDVPEVDEALSDRLVLSAIREALSNVKKALPDTRPS
ncbi:MAG: YihY/virulence factor BrkB family protein [Propionivibrio sp.]|uniref:YihY/virulence factor BrkB family protein n=1 Tax=Candidatus Propionivibrio dominans TaxID=2954373 RepID=A0A9D7IHK9_9RHOO|nr:YihY/virulence factor BrkB family protein [Candidatus Propionivibrio dominans]